jgi:hypothetical protein
MELVGQVLHQNGMEVLGHLEEVLILLLEDQYIGTAGTQTAGLKFGGAIPGSPLISESYNGSTWTSAPSINNAVGPTTGSRNTNFSINGRGIFCKWTTRL